MQFDIRKPFHILALLLIICTFALVIVSPILSFFNLLPSAQTIDVSETTGSGNLFSEVFVLILQLSLIVGFLIIVPFLWYFLVNESTLKDIFYRLKLRSKNLETASLWGFLLAVVIFAIFFIIELALISLGANAEDLGNIQDLERYFSPISLFFLVSIQPIAEEIFFRGFLLDKIESFAGGNIAILTTAVLFGLAHMSYQKLYPVIFPMIIGIFLGYIVIKLKNLYSAITAHIAFNVASFILYIFAKSLS
jgi:membrane protease YdiL (CAAX protease family)